MIGERLARVEEAIIGLRHSHNILLAVTGLGFTLVIALMLGIASYTFIKLDGLPTEFQQMNATLSAAITASKQQQPQVILIPAPTPQPQTPKPNRP